MPYIDNDRRCLIESHCNIAQLLEGLAQIEPTAGDLNYIITNIIKQYIDLKGLSYTSINSLVGVLECAKLELYRRVASPYETQKAKTNGDVY